MRYRRRYIKRSFKRRGRKRRWSNMYRSRVGRRL